MSDCARCGGIFEIVDAEYSDDHLFEKYRCENCGGTGTLSVDTSGIGSRTRTTGVVQE